MPMTNRSFSASQADVLMGMKADDLAPVRDGEPSRFAAVMRDRTWRQYVLRIKAQAQSLLHH